MHFILSFGWRWSVPHSPFIVCMCLMATNCSHEMSVKVCIDFFFFLLLPQTALWFSVSFFSATLLWSHQLHFISPISSLLILCDCFIAESINNMVLLISSMLSFSMKGWNRLSRPGREASKKLEFGNLLLGWPFLGNKNDCSVSLFIGTGTGGPVSW